MAPGTYTAAGGTFAITTGDLTLDAQGAAGATWVFQIPASLTVGLSATPRRVLLVNGALARNVYWQVGSAARIEDGSAMVGTIIARAGVTISTAGQTIQTTLTGRAIGLTASVTMVNTTIVAPWANATPTRPSAKPITSLAWACNTSSVRRCWCAAKPSGYRINDAVGNQGGVNVVSVSLVFPFGRTPTPVARVMSAPAYVAQAPAPPHPRR